MEDKTDNVLIVFYYSWLCTVPLFRLNVNIITVLLLSRIVKYLHIICLQNVNDTDITLKELLIKKKDVWVKFRRYGWSLLKIIFNKWVSPSEYASSFHIMGYPCYQQVYKRLNFMKPTFLWTLEYCNTWDTLKVLPAMHLEKARKSWPPKNLSGIFATNFNPSSGKG